MNTNVIYLAGPGVFLTQPTDLGEVDPEDVRVRFRWVAICGSDQSRFEDRRPIAYPISIGHEFVAEVIDVGTEVEGFATGDFVTSDLNFRCHTCSQCKAGRSHLCAQGQQARFSNRAFAGHGDIHASYLHNLHNHDDAHLSLAEPLSCVLHAKDWAAIGTDDRVLIVGAGSLGTCLAFGLFAEIPTMQFDIAESVPTRLACLVAAAPGAARASMMPDEYDVVFDLSGTETGLLSALQSARPGGRVCSMSHLDGYTDASFLLKSLTRRDITFTVSYLNGDASNVDRAISLLGREWNAGWDSTLAVRPVSELSTLFATHRTRAHNKTVIDVSSLGA